VNLQAAFRNQNKLFWLRSEPFEKLASIGATLDKKEKNHSHSYEIIWDWSGNKGFIG